MEGKTRSILRSIEIRYMEIFRYDIQHNIYYYILSILFFMGTFQTTDSNKRIKSVVPTKCPDGKLWAVSFPSHWPRKKSWSSRWNHDPYLRNFSIDANAAQPAAFLARVWPVLDAAHVRVRVRIGVRVDDSVRVRVGVRGWVKVGASDWVDLRASAVP